MRYAIVIDKSNPFYNKSVRVGELADGLYRITAIDEEWHTGYASEAQLQFVEDPLSQMFSHESLGLKWE